MLYYKKRQKGESDGEGSHTARGGVFILFFPCSFAGRLSFPTAVRPCASSIRSDGARHRIFRLSRGKGTALFCEKEGIMRY